MHVHSADDDVAHDHSHAHPDDLASVDPDTVSPTRKRGKYYCRQCGAYLTDGVQYTPVQELPGGARLSAQAKLTPTNEFGPDSMLVSVQNPYGFVHDFYTFKQANM